MAGPSPHLDLTTLVIPMWNETGRIRSTVEQIAASAMAPGLELVLVDDGSTDDTAAVARTALAAVALPGEVVGGLARGGKGRAVQVGVRRATGTVVAFADADLSAGPEEIERLVASVRAGRGDVVIGNRRDPRSVISTHPPWPRRLAARGFNLTCRALGLTSRADTQCGLKAFTAPAARDVFADLVSSGFAFDVEILARAERLGLRVHEEPVIWSHDRSTSVRIARHASGTLRDLARIRRRYGSIRHPKPVGPELSGER